MKPLRLSPARFPAALCLAGFLFSTAAHADTTLVYGEIGEKDDEALSAQRIYLRDGALAFETFGASRVVQFDRASGAVRLVEHGNKSFVDLDVLMVAKMAEQLNDTQRRVLNGLENKMAELNKKDREKMRGVLDELHKATELQLGKIPKTRYEKNDETAAVGQFEAEVVDAYQDERILARFFLVDHTAVGMTRGEYETLVEFQQFVRRLSKQTPGALRRNFGDFEMLAKSGKVPVQVIRYKDGRMAGKQRLLKHFDTEIDSEWFEIPEDYRTAPAPVPVPRPPGKGA